MIKCQRNGRRKFPLFTKIKNLKQNKKLNIVAFILIFCLHKQHNNWALKPLLVKCINKNNINHLDYIMTNESAQLF